MRLFHFIMLVVTLTSSNAFAKPDLSQLIKKAEQGNAVAQRDLGFAYMFGREVEEDTVKALEWYRKSADNGDTLGFQGHICNLSHAPL